MGGGSAYTKSVGQNMHPWNENQQAQNRCAQNVFKNRGSRERKSRERKTYRRCTSSLPVARELRTRTEHVPAHEEAVVATQDSKHRKMGAKEDRSSNFGLFWNCSAFISSKIIAVSRGGVITGKDYAR